MCGSCNEVNCFGTFSIFAVFKRLYMLFTEFGNIANPPILLLHGMMQDWHTEYEMLKPLEEHYRLIIPAQDGFYDGSKDFTSFADQARQIEEYIHRNHGGKVSGDWHKQIAKQQMI